MGSESLAEEAAAPKGRSEWLGTCGQCGSTALGWVSPGGFFCRGCWRSWHDGGWKAAEGPTNRKKGAVSFCGGYTSKRRRQRCDCPKAPGRGGFGCGCLDVWPPLEATIEDDSEDEALTSLSHLSYIDSHCHLEFVMHHERLGDSLWTFKKWVCPDWKLGRCYYGSDCDWAHGEEERFKPDVVTDLELLGFVVARGVTVESEVLSRLATPAPERPLKGPRLRYLIHSCCEKEALDDTRALLSAADRFGGGALFCTFGCHPHNYAEYDDEFEQHLLDGVRDFGSKVVGWGECGLDYYKNFYVVADPAARAKMVAVFARQARLAVRLGLPLVVHTRDAVEDTESVIRRLPRLHPVHFHSFQGTVAVMNKWLDLMPNSVVGLTGVLTMKRPTQNVIELAREIPLDRILLETDSPYLSADPAFIPKTARAVAKLKGISLEEVLTQTNRNCERFYKIGEFAER